MSGNTSQIFSKAGKMGWATITAANTAMDGTGTVNTIFTADATNGSRVERIRVQPLGSNVATVLRIFVNNGSTTGTAANNTLVAEIAVAATSASNSLALPFYDAPSNTDVCVLPIVLPPGYKLTVAMGTAVSAGIAVTAFGGDY